MAGYHGPPIAARAGSEVSGNRLLWTRQRVPQRLSSGVVYQGHIYLVNDNGVAECVELKTGKNVWKERLASQTWGSVVRSGNRLYVGDREGAFHVFAATPTFQRLARNDLGELTRASIAVAGDALLLRTYERLWCIAE